MTMTVIDTTGNTLPSIRTEPAAATPADSYAPVRFNAMTHGILSRLVVLPHEDHAEYDRLLGALIAEHKPDGMTQQHLVEELASIMWRKRRVLQAEGATINRGLRSVALSKTDSPIPAAAPFERGLSAEGADLSDLLAETPDGIAERQRDTQVDLAATEKAQAILRKGKANAYEKARRALLPDSRDWWDECVAEESYSADAEGLDKFIRGDLHPFCWRVAQEARHITDIQAQTAGEGVQPHRLLNLSRYETHLDRKFERTLAMLLKLKQISNG